MITRGKKARRAMLCMFGSLFLDAPRGNRARAVEVPMQGVFLRNSPAGIGIGIGRS